jgi:hypothetical protein
MYQRAQLDTPFKEGKPAGKPVVAEINHGQWIARCDQCSTTMWVDPDDPLFYCFGCGNQITGGRPRPVIFPSAEDRAVIEALLLERPVDDRRGTNNIDRAFHALPLAIGAVGGELVSLDRSWKPEESIEDLRTQNKLIEPLMQMRGAVGLKTQQVPARQAFLEAVGHFALERERQRVEKKDENAEES